VHHKSPHTVPVSESPALFLPSRTHRTVAMRRYHQISVLFILAAEPLLSLAKPHSPRWEDMHTMHSWNAVPTGWESLGHPPANITIDLYVALKPHRENAMIDALYEVSVPGHPKHVHHHSFAHVCANECYRSGADMVHISPGSKSLSLLLLTQTLLRSSKPGLNIMGCRRPSH
jgi:hypothetical protein